MTDQFIQNAEVLLKKLGTRDNVKVLYIAMSLVFTLDPIS